MFTRSSPAFRGLGRCYRLLNDWLLRWGAEPVASVGMKDGTNMMVDLRTQTDIDAYYRGEYDRLLINGVRQILDLDSTFLDVGANIGYYTVSIGKFIRDSNRAGRVVAFEPYHGNYCRLLENIQRNNLESVCHANPVGLSNRSGESRITLREDFSRGSGTGNAAIPTSEQFDQGFSKVPITLVTLDSIWISQQGLQGIIDMIKLDIEGHEGFFLQGARNTIENHRPTLLMEVNKPYYIARGANIDSEVLPQLPQDYLIFKVQGKQWTQINSLGACGMIDNVMFVPEEKMNRTGYEIFGRAKL